MNTAELQELAERSRSMRQSGFALLLSSGILALFLFVPTISRPSSPSPITVATSTAPNAFQAVTVAAKAAIVYDLVTGETLFAKNAAVQLPLASLTKLLTVYAALSVLSPSTLITIPAEVMQMEAPHAFSVGQTFSLANLARLTLTASLNDGAASIALAAAARQNSTESALLANAATALNLSQTYAVNGSGLDMSSAISGGYGSAHDVAVLAGALVKVAPAIAIATTRDSAQAVSEGGTSFSVRNTDPVTMSISRLLLSKTGYTDLAGGNLALVFDAGIEHPIAVIVLGSSKESRFTDGTALVNATLAHFAGVSAL